MSRYQHSQRGWIHYLMVGLAALQIGLAFALPEGRPFLLLLGGLFLLVAACFAELSVEDDGDALLVAFGPLRLLKRRVPYADIVSAEADRTRFIDGWGIHLTSRGWLWNVTGRDAVRLNLKSGSLRVGTDDPQGLLRFLQRKLAGS